MAGCETRLPLHASVRHNSGILTYTEPIEGNLNWQFQIFDYKQAVQCCAQCTQSLEQQLVTITTRRHVYRAEDDA